ncbi:hypothetical protein Q2941_48320 [Bradyrhizobium sp. UFLA05-153]
MQRFENDAAKATDLVLDDQDVPLVVQLACVIIQKYDKNFTEAMARALYAWLSMEMDFTDDPGVPVTGAPDGQRVTAHRDARGFFLRFEQA